MSKEEKPCLWTLEYRKTYAKRMYLIIIAPANSPAETVKEMAEQNFKENRELTEYRFHEARQSKTILCQHPNRIHWIKCSGIK